MKPKSPAHARAVTVMAVAGTLYTTWMLLSDDYKATLIFGMATVLYILMRG